MTRNGILCLPSLISHLITAAGRFKGALDNDFKAIDESPYSLKNHRRSQVIPGGWVYAVSSRRHLGQGCHLYGSREKSACSNTQAFAN